MLSQGAAAADEEEEEAVERGEGSGACDGQDRGGIRKGERRQLIKPGKAETKDCCIGSGG